MSGVNFIILDMILRAQLVEGDLRVRQLVGCADTPGYIDVNNNGCSAWAAISCNQAVEMFGYTQLQEDDLLVGCAETCGVCGTDHTAVKYVTGCADNLWNGEYKSGAIKNTNLDGWVKDATHQICFYGGKWRIANHGARPYAAETSSPHASDPADAAFENTCVVSRQAAPTAAPTSVDTTPTPLGSSSDCGDEPGYLDELSAPCSNWIGYPCDEAQNLYGYTRAGRIALLANCEESCEVCSAPPTPAPTNSPTVAQTPAPTSVDSTPTLPGSSADCGDEPGYLDELSAPCSNWIGYPCDEAHNLYGYTAAGQTALLANCKESCELCPAQPKPAPTNSPTVVDTLGYADGCADTPGYTDAYNQGCSDWAGTPCNQASEWYSYTQAQEDDLLVGCAETCGVCGTDPTVAPTAAPTSVHSTTTPPGSSGDCGDEPGYLDELSAPCSNWIGYPCDEAQNRYGYTVAGQTALVANCEESCEVCSASPTPAPTNSPSAQRRMQTSGAKGSANPPGYADGPDGCADTLGYTDADNHSCSAWAGTPCNQAVEWYSYTQRQEDDLLVGCAETCGVCGTDPTVAPTAAPTSVDSTSTLPGVPGECADVPGYLDELSTPCSNWVGYPCDEAHNVYGYTAAGRTALLANCKESCEVCSAPPTPAPTNSPTVADTLGYADGCADTLGYTDAYNQGCSDWAGTPCNHAVEWYSYTHAQEDDLLVGCAETCGVCGTDPTVAPTAAPTSVDSTPTPPGSSADCGDEPGYLDELSAPCSNWIGYPCDEAQNLYGHTAAGQTALVANCKESCKVCSAPTPAPTSPIVECADSPGYTDATNQRCSDWAAWPWACNQALERLGYTQAQVDDLLVGCAESCGVCGTDPTAVKYVTGCADNLWNGKYKSGAIKDTNLDGWVKDTTHSIYVLGGKWRIANHGARPYASETSSPHASDPTDAAFENACVVSRQVASTPAPTSVDCAPTPPGCSGDCCDEPGYLDELSAPCCYWVDYPCDQAQSKYFYTAAGQTALLANCKASCEVCSAPPTPAPTKSPSRILLGSSADRSNTTAAVTSVNTQTAEFLSDAGLEAAALAPIMATPARTQGGYDADVALKQLL